MLPLTQHLVTSKPFDDRAMTPDRLRPACVWPSFGCVCYPRVLRPTPAPHSQRDFKQPRQLISKRCAADGIRPASMTRAAVGSRAPACHQSSAGTILAERRAVNAAAAPPLPPATVRRCHRLPLSPPMFSALRPVVFVRCLFVRCLCDACLCDVCVMRVRGLTADMIRCVRCTTGVMVDYEGERLLKC